MVLFVTVTIFVKRLFFVIFARFIDMAADFVVIYHADRLHKGVDNDGADEFETTFLEVFGQCNACLAINRNVLLAFPCILKRRACQRNPRDIRKNQYLLSSRILQ